MLKMLAVFMSPTRRQRRRKSIMICLLIARLARPEEKSAWEDAVVECSNTQYPGSSPFDNLIHGTLKELLHTNGFDTT